MTRDPIGYLDGLNSFNYVRNDPVTRLDPTGLGCMIYYDCELKDEATKNHLIGVTCVYVCHDTARHFCYDPDGGRDLHCETPPLDSIEVGKLTTVRWARRYQDECPCERKFKEPYDFDPGNNFIPPMSYPECVKNCGKADPVKHICRFIKKGHFGLRLLCKALVGTSKEACISFCHVFQDGNPPPGDDWGKTLD